MISWYLVAENPEEAKWALAYFPYDFQEVHIGYPPATFLHVAHGKNNRVLVVVRRFWSWVSSFFPVGTPVTHEQVVTWLQTRSIKGEQPLAFRCNLLHTYHRLLSECEVRILLDPDKIRAQPHVFQEKLGHVLPDLPIVAALRMPAIALFSPADRQLIWSRAHTRVEELVFRGA